MRRIAEQHGPQAVAFSQSSPSTTAIADSAVFIRRLMTARPTRYRTSTCAAGDAVLLRATSSA
jgi:hypothetical protein